MASSTFRAGQVVRLRYMHERYGADVRVRLLCPHGDVDDEPAWKWELVLGVFDWPNGWDAEYSFEKLDGLLDI